MRSQLSCFRGLTVGLTCPEPPGQGRQFFLCSFTVFLFSMYTYVVVLAAVRHFYRSAVL